MHLCEGWVWENAYSSLKSVETPINLCIILFDNHSHPCEKKPAFLQLLRSFKSFAKASQKPAVLAPAYLL